MKNDKKSEKEMTRRFMINIRSLKNFDSSLKILKSYNLMGCFWLKDIMDALRKCCWVMFDTSQSWYKLWRKTGSCFYKWHVEFGKLKPEYLRVLKLELWWHAVVQSRKCISLNLTGELCVMTMDSGAKL